MLSTFVLIIHVIIAFLIIGLVLLQKGKGAETGTSFGAGASGTVFGSSGSATFLSKLTSYLVIIFFITSLTLGYLAKKQISKSSELGLPKQEIIEKQSDVPVFEKEKNEEVPTLDNINQTENNENSENKDLKDKQQTE